MPSFKMFFVLSNNAAATVVIAAEVANSESYTASAVDIHCCRKGELMTTKKVLQL